jgi:hypothetical protein
LLGALIVTLPISAGPAYFFLVLDHGPEFIAASALGSLAINAANGIFGLVYAVLAQRRGLLMSLASALAVWVALATTLRAIEWTLAGALLLNVAVYAVCLPLAAHFRHAIMPVYRRRWYDAPLRALLVCGIVTAVLGLSTRVGPTATGIMATAPIVMTSMALILHPRVGGAVSAAVIANSLTGLVGFGVSVIVPHIAAVPLGNAAALVLWLLASMGWNLCLWGLWRRRIPLRSRTPRQKVSFDAGNVRPTSGSCAACAGARPRRRPVRQARQSKGG